ncbi:sulfatase [Myxococcota bacterium]|nr:sulfatase [Myxococcota bacterium]
MNTWIAAFLALAGAGARASTGAPATEGVLALDRRPDLLVEVDLPPSSREAEVQDTVEVPGGWLLVSTADGVRTWQAALPVRPRTLFFHRPPEGMELVRREAGQDWSQGRVVPHKNGLEDAHRADSWEFNAQVLRVRRPAAQGPPGPGEYAVRYPKAAERERDLQREAFDGTDADFVMRSFQVDDTTRHGLLLPAPARAAFDLQVPAGAVLSFSAGILPAEAALAGAHSDGAELVVKIDGAEVGRHPLREGAQEARRHDLSSWSGQQVRLELQVEPGPTRDLDYAFVASPVLYTPVVDPPRVVVLFVDTLRQDALSMYGYHRPTTPRLDAWAAGGTIFDQARSVAPWTLPSTRAMFLGTQPERWSEATTVQEQAARAGWATAFLSGNVYLSSNFEMDRGWGTHRCVNWPTADVQVRRARRWLAEHDDRPALLVLHLMDMHLPYTEPRAYRHRFAGEHFEALGDEQFQRSEVLKALSRIGDEGKQYIRDRYDNNLAFVDDQLGAFLDDLQPQDTVILLADHGEEFWDHGDFEHGHTLYDELLRVPLVVVGPGVPAGRSDLPVSLLDVAPTLATAMGLSTQGMTGRPLQGAADGSATAELVGRPIGFGRPLYGQRRWGVVDEGLKYTQHDGRERVYDLATDPGEARDLVTGGQAPVEALVQAMSEAVERPVVTVLRLVPSRSTSADDLVVTARVPGGVRRAWAAEDPMQTVAVQVESSVDNQVTITWKGRTSGDVEAYLLPELPLDQALPQLEITVQHRGPPTTLAPVQTVDWPQPWRGSPVTLLRGRSGGRTVAVDYARVPLPAEDATKLVGVDAELQEDLKALGYFEE